MRIKAIRGAHNGPRQRHLLLQTLLVGLFFKNGRIEGSAREGEGSGTTKSKHCKSTKHTWRLAVS